MLNQKATMSYHLFFPQLGPDLYEFSEMSDHAGKTTFTRMIISYADECFDDIFESDFLYFVSEPLKDQLETEFPKYLTFKPVEIAQSSTKKPSSRRVYQVLFDSSHPQSPIRVEDTTGDSIISSDFLKVLENFNISGATINKETEGSVFYEEFKKDPSLSVTMLGLESCKEVVYFNARTKGTSFQIDRAQH